MEKLCIWPLIFYHVNLPTMHVLIYTLSLSFQSFAQRLDLKFSKK